MNIEERGILFKDEYRGHRYTVQGSIWGKEVYCSRMNKEDRGILFKDEYI